MLIRTQRYLRLDQVLRVNIVFSSFSVRDLDDLQILMDRLLDANSVMSVERRFGSVLLDTM
ncbi:LOW QUALITY PROTEIN: hypothetical protein ACHAXN_003948 [Cyclotella atomus]